MGNSQNKQNCSASRESVVEVGAEAVLSSTFVTDCDRQTIATPDSDIPDKGKKFFDRWRKHHKNKQHEFAISLSSGSNNISSRNNLSTLAEQLNKFNGTKVAVAASSSNGSNTDETFSTTNLLDTRYSLSSSRSFINFGQFRTKSIASSNITTTHTPATSKSAHDLSTLSKTYWPIPYIESTFLPHFPLANRTFCDKYHIESLIERGSFGVVYQVADSDGRQYALKILNKSQIIRNGSLAQVKNEVDIQTICGHHPFIVECVIYWQTHRKICILTEFISGGELFNRIKRFSYQLVQLYVLEIAIAIDFLHNAGIIYRDLKPENILLDTENHIKLVDFGLSKWLKIGQRTKTFCGTLQYMGRVFL